MSLSYEQILALCQEIKPLLVKGLFVDCVEIGPRKYFLFFEKAGQFLKVLVSFQDPFLRFHLSNARAEQRETEFTRKISEALKGMPLIDLKILNEDRIAAFVFSKFTLYAEFFPRKSNFYLLNDQKEILVSLNPTSTTLYSFPAKPLSRKEFASSVDNSAHIEAEYAALEAQAEFEKLKQTIRSHLNQTIRRIEKQIQQRSDQMEICKKWEAVQHEGILLQSNLFQLKKGMVQITVSDWEAGGEKVIELDPRLEPHIEVAKRFRQSKKMQGGLQRAQEDLIRLNEELIKNQQIIGELENVKVLRDLQPFQSISLPIKAKTIQEPQSAVPYREYTSSSGVKIWVGKSAAKNDELTFRYANGLDCWLHVIDFPGSHVIIKSQNPDEETLKDAAELALRYSKAKGKGKAEVGYTQCKFVSRFGKVKGKVQLAKHKVLHIALNETRWKRLKDRGQSD